MSVFRFLPLLPAPAAALAQPAITTARGNSLLPFRHDQTYPHGLRASSRLPRPHYQL